MTATGRTTHTIETPVGKQKVVINDWMTGGEKRKMSGMNESAAAVSLIESLVVSIDEKTDKIMETMDSMHGKDFDFILNDLGEVAAGSSLEKKTA